MRAFGVRWLKRKKHRWVLERLIAPTAAAELMLLLDPWRQGSPVSTPNTGHSITLGVHTHVPVQCHHLAAVKSNPNIPVHGCTLQRRQACGASQACIFPHLPLFQRVLSYHPPLPTQPPHFHMLPAFKANISPRLFGLVCLPRLLGGPFIRQDHGEPGKHYLRGTVNRGWGCE